MERGTAAPHFSANVYCGLWPNGRPSQQLLSYCLSYSTSHKVRARHPEGSPFRGSTIPKVRVRVRVDVSSVRFRVRFSGSRVSRDG